MEQAEFVYILMVCHSSNVFRIHMPVTLTGLAAKLTLCFIVLRVKQRLNNLFASLLPVDPFRTFRIHKHTFMCTHNRMHFRKEQILNFMRVEEASC